MDTIERETGIKWENPKEAFGRAIASGLLSADMTASNYAGHWMYMGTENGVDLFKNIDTRKYIRGAVRS